MTKLPRPDSLPPEPETLSCAPDSGLPPQPPLPKAVPLSSEELLSRLERHDTFVLIECPEGRDPQMRTMQDISILIRRLTKLEGEDTNVFVVFGTPFNVTEKDQAGMRHLTDASRDVAKPVAIRLDAAASEMRIHEGEAARMVRELHPPDPHGWLGDPWIVAGSALLPTSYSQPRAQVQKGPDYRPFEGEGED